MAASIDDLVKQLNLNKTDSAELSNALQDYFDRPTDDPDSDDDSDASSDDDDDGLESDFLPVIPDVASLVLAPALPATPATLRNATPPTQNQFPSATAPCKCKLNNGNPCHSLFSVEDVATCQENFMELSQNKEHFDIAILAKLQCGLHSRDFTCSSKKGTQKERQRNRLDYYHQGQKICRDFFLFLPCLKKDKLQSLLSHLQKNNVTPRTHGNKSKLPHNVLKFNQIRQVIDFITNYAEQNAITLPGRHPKHWICDAQLLPTSCTKRHVYSLYQAAADSNGYRQVSKSLFCDMWKKLVPFIRTMPPASDLCWQCQETTKKMMRTANRPEEEKKECVRALESHLAIVNQERDFYREILRKVREQPGITERIPGKHPYCSFQMNHISFDFAQQTHYPSSPQQPGPIYFKCPRKCGLFGVNSEGKSLQANYLIDESHCCGKGANTVISYLHDFLENHSLGERELYLHADNASGQNKNNYVMWYLLWRCLTGKNKKIRISFLIAGHTKFSTDGGFGLLKRKLKREEINCLEDIARATNTSAEMNIAKIVGLENDPVSAIPTYDWASFLKPHFNTIQGVKSFHHFIFSDSPTVTVMEHCESTQKTQNLFSRRPSFPNDLPDIITPPGLSPARQWYLYNQIREFVADDKKDTVCPLPQVAQQPTTAIADDETETGQPAPKRAKTAKGSTSKGKKKA